MARGLSRFLRGAVNTGAAAAPLGPQAALPAAAVGGFLEAFTGGQPKFDPKPYRDAFDRYHKAAMTRTRQASRELGAQQGAMLAASGINDSEVGAFLKTANKRRLYQNTLDASNAASANLESQLAHAEAMFERSQDMAERNRWGHTRNMLLEQLDAYANPEQTATELPEAAQLREQMESWGFDDQTVNQYLQAMGHNTAPAAPAKSGHPQRMIPGFTGAHGTTDPFNPRKQAINAEQAKANAKLLGQVKGALGNVLSEFIEESLGEDWHDLFRWEN